MSQPATHSAHFDNDGDDDDVQFVGMSPATAARSTAADGADSAAASGAAAAGDEDEDEDADDEPARKRRKMQQEEDDARLARDLQRQFDEEAQYRPPPPPPPQVPQPHQPHQPHQPPLPPIALLQHMLQSLPQHPQYAPSAPSAAAAVPAQDQAAFVASLSPDDRELWQLVQRSDTRSVDVNDPDLDMQIFTAKKDKLRELLVMFPWADSLAKMALHALEDSFETAVERLLEQSASSDAAASTDSQRSRQLAQAVPRDSVSGSDAASAASAAASAAASSDAGASGAAPRDEQASIALVVQAPCRDGETESRSFRLKTRVSNTGQKLISSVQRHAQGQVGLNLSAGRFRLQWDGQVVNPQLSIGEQGLEDGDILDIELIHGEDGDGGGSSGAQHKG